MYIQAEAEKYLDASKEIIARLHTENKRENFILNTKFKECYFPAHAENLSLKFAFTGNEYYEYGKRKVAVNPGNFLIINQGQEHTSWIYSDIWVNSFAIYFTPLFTSAALNDLILSDGYLLDNPFELKDKTGKLSFFQNLLPLDAAFIQQIILFKKYLEETGGQETLIVDGMLRELFAKVITAHQNHLAAELPNLSAAKIATKIEALKRVHTARDFIESFYTDRISIHDIASGCYLSENLLLRYFKAVFGISPHQYIINKRLELAKELILKTDCAINEITYRIGFECPSSFIRLFRERFGATPSSLRKSV